MLDDWKEYLESLQRPTDSDNGSEQESPEETPPAEAQPVEEAPPPPRQEPPVE